eukprot:TRINITY_DN13615_c0_g3_i1.p1 TRINITY_DN13615_c0_g3~~TRINITY_DN13615_c0_g3_i1.p1  ORF type:complete len:864 (+),score=197.52 TRINITY_DN13615_c0_g3_i1:42-2633(+)
MALKPPGEELKLREYGRKTTQRRIGKENKNLGPAVEENLDAYKVSRSMDSATQELIKKGIKQDRVCAMLEDAEVESILQNMEYLEFGAGVPVIEKGKKGTTFFVIEKGCMEVSIDGLVCNTVGEGSAFGSLALLYDCPRTATVTSTADSKVWAAKGTTFKKVLQENAVNHQAENLKFLNATQVFDGLTFKQKDKLCEAAFSEVFEENSRVLTAGEMQTAIYFVRKGELKVFTGGKVESTGEFVNGTEISRFGPGDCFGESQLLKSEPWNITVVAATRCELLCVSVTELTGLLGNDLAAVLESNFIVQSLSKGPVMSQFTPSQRQSLMSFIVVKDYAPEVPVDAGLRFLVVLDGQVNGINSEKLPKLVRGDWLEDGEGTDKTQIKPMVSGPAGSRLGFLTAEGLAAALQQLGLSSIGSAEDASDFTRKMVLAKKVNVFRHLSEEQTKKFVQSFVTQKFTKGSNVITQGEPGTAFYVIASGEVQVFIDGKSIRLMGRNTYFGERALLFDEPRTATVEVVSPDAELWSVEKAAFTQIVHGNMQQELMNRIRLQDTNFGLKDLKQVRVIGAGAAGVVRLVQHKTTGTRYALKRVQKVDGEVPEEVQRECSLLKDMDHPFIMTQVQTYETAKSVYILTELITGGELHGAIREIPTVLARSQAQFYTGTLIIVLEELSSRSIVYRDLKPENVMLDAQGYLKLIDFGIAKKLPEGSSRTFTMIGTPHYMAPEVMRGHGYGTAVDLWSLGVMLFEFVCGYLPFADDLDDPTEVCTAVLKDPLSFPSTYKCENGKALMKGLLCRQPRKRLGSGLSGWEDVRNAPYFKMGFDNSSLFDMLMGRELRPPVLPDGEKYCDPDEVDDTLSDANELG